MTPQQSYTIKNRLDELLLEIKELRRDLTQVNHDQDERITANSTFRTNTIAVLKVVMIIISGIAGGLSLYYFGP